MALPSDLAPVSVTFSGMGDDGQPMTGTFSFLGTALRRRKATKLVLGPVRRTVALAGDGTLATTLPPNVDAQYQGRGLYQVTADLRLSDGTRVAIADFPMQLREDGGPYDLSDFMTEFGALPPLITDNNDGTLSGAVIDNGDGTLSA